MFGQARMFRIGLIVFVVASVAGGLAVEPVLLIASRVVQGIGAAFLLANSAAILTDAFPENQRGMALGINQIAGISGQFVGLLLGGVLAAIDWRLVFWVNVPFVRNSVSVPARAVPGW